MAYPSPNGANTETASVKAAAGVITSTIDGTSAVLVELLRASAANPVMAAAAIIILNDILAQRGIISQDANEALALFIATLTAAEVISGTMKQSVTTLAYGAEAATSAAALLGLLA